MQESELILMAPTQLKKKPSFGSIYDWVLIDFYAKVRRMQGVKVQVPLMWNINGIPVLRMMEKEGLPRSSTSIKTFADECINKSLTDIADYSIQFDDVIRDDSVQDLLNAFLDKYTKDRVRIGPITLSVCKKCDTHFGTDPSLQICKICHGQLVREMRGALYQNIDKKNIADIISSLVINPRGAKKELLDFNYSMPENYNLVVTKKRDYTLEYRGFQLDPRFIVMIMPALIKGSFQRRTYIHGDVIKKFSYYSICHLPPEYLPTSIFSHGVLLDSRGRKLRWQDGNIAGEDLVNGLSKKLLRALFLKRNPSKDLIIDSTFLIQQIKEQEDLLNKINRILTRNMRDEALRTSIADFEQKFLDAASKFHFGVAYDIMYRAVDLLDKNGNIGLHPREIKLLQSFRELYFGK